MMWTVGITGFSGSGKTILSQYYASLGYAVEDGDILSRAVCMPNSACVKELCHAFGSTIVDENGALMRRTLGEKVYQDPSMNQKLIEIVHPYILKELLQREQRAKENGASFLFLDGAMIVGSIFEAHCHKLILVETDPTNSIKRIVARDGVSATVAKSRLTSQVQRNKLRNAADYIIYNNSNLKDFYDQADNLLQQLQDARTQCL